MSVSDNIHNVEVALGLAEVEITDTSKAQLPKFVPGYNKIFYGIPGSGKSYHIQHRILEEWKDNVLVSKVKESNVFRTTFYLEYSNVDFIGQILPSIGEDETVSYRYTPGPFTKALEQALLNKDKKENVYLIIEELNRGNAAAIFGETFQLLDRKEDGSSEYSISNSFIENYFAQENEDGKNIDYSPNHLIIPSNLIIVATMNTSDQNVFPLDTAFRRRWDKELIEGEWGDCKFASWYIPCTNVTWEQFAKVANKKMIDGADEGSNYEDKRLGPWFAEESMFCKDEKDMSANSEKALIKFVNKVMEYLWSDVSKFDKELIFAKYKSFDEIYYQVLQYAKNNKEENYDFCFKDFEKEE